MRGAFVPVAGLVCAGAWGCAADRPQSADRAVAKAYPGYTLAWSDEFDADGPVNDADWVYEEGFVRNQEAQWYQAANVVRRGGLLVIEARRERAINGGYEAGSKDWKKSRDHADYTSGSIKTRGRHAWLYGRFEMRGRIDTRAGLWPAFWTVGSARPWPACGEIDIMEFYRGTLLANAAWGSERPGVGVWDDVKRPIAEVARQAGYAGVKEWSEAFHTWRMDWDEASIRLYVDDRLMNEVDLSRTVNRSGDGANPFHEPHHIILNLAVGSTGGDPAGTAFPARFEVDWVRVYQREAVPMREVIGLPASRRRSQGRRRTWSLRPWRCRR